MNQNGNSEKDMFHFSLCRFTSLWVYKDPFNKNKVSFEIISSFEDLPKFDVRSIDLRDLGLKSFDELEKKIKKDKRFLLQVLRIFNEDYVEDDRRPNCDEIEDYLSVYGLCYWSRNEKRKRRTMVIEEFEDGSGFRFWVEGDGCGWGWKVVQHPDDPERVVLYFEQFEREIGFVFSEYSDFSVDHDIKNMQDLLKYMKEDPYQTAYYITLYQDLDFDDVKVVKKSSNK